MLNDGKRCLCVMTYGSAGFSICNDLCLKVFDADTEYSRRIQKREKHVIDIEENTEVL